MQNSHLPDGLLAGTDKTRNVGIFQASRKIPEHEKKKKFSIKVHMSTVLFLELYVSF